jgi:hypothetical protein
VTKNYAAEQAELALALAWRALRLDREEPVAAAQLTGDDPAVPGVVWHDVAVILDASDPQLRYVERVFSAVAERPLPLPDREGVAVRVDLLGCSGLQPLVARFGHGIRLWDAVRQLTVADAIAECAQASPPPQHLVLVTDRAPTGDWRPELTRWRLAVERHGRTPQTSHAIWGEHLAEFDGFTQVGRENRLYPMTSPADIVQLLSSLWQHTPRPVHGHRCPPRARPVRLLKPFLQ